MLKRPLPPIHNIGAEEIAAATRVLERGPLSGFLASGKSGFYGGEEVRALEEQFAERFEIKHALAFNSATTALQAAVAALSIGPGDEVIVPPYTMSATATAVLLNGAVPIFADIDPRTFCIDPVSVRERVTPHTKAIIAVNLFGQSADYDALTEIAQEHHLSIIEDNAQAPGARYDGRYTGTIGDIGVFSFNIHKTIQAGEGGILVTNSDAYALRAALSRNHGEVAVDEMPGYDLGPIVGSNYRMTEIAAAIMTVQLRKLEALNHSRIELADHLRGQLEGVPGITLPYVHPKSTHVYYRFVLTVNEEEFGISRDRVVDAMNAEGFAMSKGYVKPIYLLPVFQQRRVFNDTQFPFVYGTYRASQEYTRGLCPVAEELYEKTCTLTDVCQHPYTKEHVDLFVTALRKVFAYRDELR